MGTQQSSRSQATRKQASVKQTNTELDCIFKRSIFWRPSYIAQSAWLEHIPFAFWVVDTLRPRKIVELGTHYGSSYFSFCQAITKLDLETQCYAVDTWGGDEHAGQYGEEVYRQVSEYNQQHYSDFSTLVRSTFDQALEHFPQGGIDLLHIDGLHTLEAVRHDFESWLPKLSERAVVIMHDTNVRERGFGVFQLLDELKQQYPHFEFAHGHGLGILGVGSEQSAEMMSLYELSGNASATKQVQEVFSRLGKACGYSWENSEIKRQMVSLQANQQAETQDFMEQQALERGRLAEKITAQHHVIKTLEDKLAQHGDQTAELNLEKQQISALTAELTKSSQLASELQMALTLCEQQRDENLACKQNMETALNGTRQKLDQVITERDLILQENQSLLEQYTEAQEQQTALQQQLHEKALQLNEEFQRTAQLSLALSKSNIVLTDNSHQLSALQKQIDEQKATLSLTHQQKNELTQAMASKENEIIHWKEQYQELVQSNHKLQMNYDGLISDLDTSRGILEQTQNDISALQQQRQAEQLEYQQQFNILNQTLSERLAEIVTLTHVIENRDQAVENAEKKQKSLEEDNYNYQLALLDEQQQRKAEQAEYQLQLSTLQQTVNDRFNEIITLTKLLEEQEQLQKNTAAHLQKIIEDNKALQEIRRNEQQQHEVAETEYQQQLSILNQTLRERFTEIATLTNWVEEHESALTNSAAEKQKLKKEHHENQQAWLNEQATMVKNKADLQQQLFTCQEQATQQKSSLDEQISKLLKQNEVLEANISERFRELATMTNLVEHQSREIRNGEHQIAQLKSRISKLKGTVSWRLTAPVRALAKPFKESSTYSVSQINTIAESGYFDEQWYRQQYPECLNAASVIEHYLNIGAKNGYNPSQKFDTNWYLNTYPDVANGDVNPLLHYILHGQHEGRLCSSQA